MNAQAPPPRTHVQRAALLPVRLRTLRLALGVPVAAACAAVLLFHVVSLASGRLEVSGGRGWDGEGYARMTTESLTRGTANTQLRPLLPLVARIPYELGLSVVASFELLNHLYAFVLYLAAGLLLRRERAPAAVTCVVVANLALCIATSKMFGFYPVQIDLGALALATVAFYFVRTDRRWPASVACVLAAVSREFGAAVAIYGIARAIRQRRPWRETLLVYLPAFAGALFVRWWVVSSAEDVRGPLTAGDALQNLGLWLSPAFVAAFVYFAVVLFGGISALLVVRARWSLTRMREEPELAVYLLIFVALTAVGSFDIWRYLAFTLPVAMVLAGQYFRDAHPEVIRRMLTAVTVITLLTQRPFELMSTSLYFRDWFPLYRYFEGSEEVVAVWTVRLASVALLMAALLLTARRNGRMGRLAA